jgi:hypothetical protein
VTPPRRFTFHAALLLLLAAACSSDPAAPATDGAAGDAHGGGPGKPGVGSEACPEGTNPHGQPNPLSIGVVSGELVDEQGEPTTAGLVQICGIDVCNNAKVGSNGKFVESVGVTIDTPACKFGDGFTWAKLALPIAEGDTELGKLVTVRLPEYEGAPPLTPGKTVSSGGVSLELTPSAHVQVNSLDYETEAERGFRAVALPEAARARLEMDFEVAFALSPLETRICPSPSLSLENLTELDPGTELELYVLGLDASEELVPYARWSKVGEGQVSEDGASLLFPEGVPVLTAIGVKVKA